MRPLHLLLAAALLAAAPAAAQLPGQKLPGPTDTRGRDALLSPSNPGVAPPLDIRIQDEGLQLPRGVGDDAPPPKPAPAEAPAPKPEAKKP
jgi:hypothetical protein